MLPAAQTHQLSALRNSAGLFSLVGWHESELLASLFGLDWAEPETKDFVQELIHELHASRPPDISGLVLDPRTGLNVLTNKEPNTGVALRLSEFQTQLTIAQAPALLPNWGIEQVSNNYATAYLRLYYHPAEAAALEKKQLVAELYDFCQYEQTELLLDLALTEGDEGEDREQALLEALTEFRSMAHGLGLPYPGSPLLAATVTAELDIPWLLSSDYQQPYATYKEQVRQSVESGAQGFLIADTLYQELETARQEDHSPDLGQIKQLIATTIRDRLLELTRIAAESHQPLL